MSRMLTEQKVLEKLGIDDFSQLTKDNVTTLVSMKDKMPPEVAKKALEQFPDFSKTMNEILNNYEDTLNKGIAANNKSVMRYYDSCNAIISSLQKELERKHLTFRKRKYIIDQMLELSNKMGEKDTENKKFILRFVTLSATGLAAATTVVKSINKKA